MLSTTFLHKEPRTGKSSAKGQVLIESTVSIVAIFIFLLGMLQIFIWMNRSMIARQRAYQETRTQLGQNVASIDFYVIDEANAGRQLRVFEAEQ